MKWSRDQKTKLSIPKISLQHSHSDIFIYFCLCRMMNLVCSTELLLTLLFNQNTLMSHTHSFLKSVCFTARSQSTCQSWTNFLKLLSTGNCIKPAYVAHRWSCSQFKKSEQQETADLMFNNNSQLTFTCYFRNRKLKCDTACVCVMAQKKPSLGNKTPVTHHEMPRWKTSTPQMSYMVAPWVSWIHGSQDN